MVYPPNPHTERDTDAIASLMREFPFAHLFTTVAGEHRVTRLPFALDVESGSLKRLRAHLSAKNPQANQIDDADVLVAFSGADSYVSPNWRCENDRGATWDYSAVHVWGRAKRRPERAYFEQLIIDLADAAETRHQGVSEKPNWSIGDAPKDYVDRLHPMLVAFEIEITRIEGISKFHQEFPVEDALSVATHLERSDDPQSRAVAAKIRHHNANRMKDFE